MKDIRAKYEKASKQYLNQVKLDEDVIGVIISGSLKYANIDTNSDIDVYVILNAGCEYRERGNTWINGVEIEYFKNPPQQIRAYFKKEMKSPHTAHMIALGELVYCTSDEVMNLIEEAKSILNELPPEMKPIEIELERYFLDDQFKDFEDCLDNNNQIGADLIRHKLINRSIDIFCKTHQLIRDKDKRVHLQISSIDEDFLELVQFALGENWNEQVHLHQLKCRSEELLGGKRPKEWILKSNLEIE